jgi:acyl carrier protein
MADPVGISSAEELRVWLTGRFAEFLEIEPGEVDPDVSFESQGLDSMGALTLCDEIEDHLKIVVEPTLAWDYPTITKLAEFLHDTVQQGGTAQ